MAYQTVEQDDVLDQGTQPLEFKSFLGPEATVENGAPSTGSTHNPGYLRDQGRGNSAFWNVEYYQQYFDVDTKTVIERCYTTLWPLSPSYRTAHVTPAPDLYGPFWTLTSVIFSLFVFSSLASSVSSYLSDTPIQYDFKLLSIAVSLVYAYGLGVPILLWLALRYLGVSEWSVIEAISVWGYGQFVWIPVSLLCVIPEPIVRWTLVGVAFGLSGYYLVANVYPVLETAEAKAARLIVIIIALMHAALALCLKVLFFSFYVTASSTKDPLAGGTPEPPKSDTKLFF